MNNDTHALPYEKISQDSKKYIENRATNKNNTAIIGNKRKT